MCPYDGDTRSTYTGGLSTGLVTRVHQTKRACDGPGRFTQVQVGPKGFNAQALPASTMLTWGRSILEYEHVLILLLLLELDLACFREAQLYKV